MPATSDEEDFEVRAARRSLLLRLVMIGLILVAIGMGSMVVLALLFPMMAARRERARREQAKENLRQLGIALQNYDQTHRQQPQSATAEGVSSDKE